MLFFVDTRSQPQQEPMAIYSSSTLINASSAAFALGLLDATITMHRRCLTSHNLNNMVH
jgi:hypothetical protein